MVCQRCKSERVLSASGKSSDCNSGQIGRKEYVGDYIPEGLGIGSGDYYEIDVCLNCGQLQGWFPLAISKFELKDDEVDE